MSPFSIRRATTADHAAVEALCAKVFGEEVGAKAGAAVSDLGTRLGNLGEPIAFPVHSAYWLAESPESELLGIVGLFAKRWIGKQNLYLGWFAVDPERQGQGIGRGLLEYAKEIAREMGARWIYTETAPEPEATIRFYEKAGFQRCAECSDYWEEGEPLLLYRLRL